MHVDLCCESQIYCETDSMKFIRGEKDFRAALRAVLPELWFREEVLSSENVP